MSLNLSILRPPAWVEHAACTPEDAELWFPHVRSPDTPRASDESGDTSYAVSICNECPVKAECLQDAIETGDPWGIRGGMTPHQRKLLKRRGRAA